jgi:hypothetical protein
VLSKLTSQVNIQEVIDKMGMMLRERDVGGGKLQGMLIVTRTSWMLMFSVHC